MKNYKVRFNGSIIVYFNGVCMRERMVGDGGKLDKPFKVIEFLRDSKVIAEFYPDKWFSYEIEEIPY